MHFDQMHFDDVAWLGFVRGSLTTDERWLMQQHLTVGCSECSAAHAFWTRVMDLIAREADYELDASDIRLFTATAFEGEAREVAVNKMTILARLLFDSFRDDAPAGFRSALMQARHIVLSAGQWTISLRIKRESGNQVFLAGHVTRADTAASAPSRMEVTLRQAESPVGSATTNLSGEFHLQYRDASDLRLFVKVSEAETLEIPLPDQDPTSVVSTN